MEMQVLCGVLPIARLSAIPSCVYFAAQLLPLEEIFKLTHPSSLDPPAEDKRTWREGLKRPDRKPIQWTAMDILVAYANKKCWFTSQAGRPDIHRAGNAILRALAENKVPWSFWPPGTPIDLIEAVMDSDDKGLWIWKDEIASGNEGSPSEEDESGSEGTDHPDDASTCTYLGETEEDGGADLKDAVIGEDEEDEIHASKIGGRFALLGTDADEDGDED
ncbi:hypothetical protein E1B28_001451 [Marasmius oreades]|uniref:Uncharacterized protein n=1 Tax=Marasmius oreades TaxID=181124 RepID=A0A9P7V3G0_9AGAR|nr:uncharacterized protein E1B28_001451 [Marasmius oreades]KAG7099623.1 hypothetical protein E1B28_001451 [Marasmius oreades]